MYELYVASASANARKALAFGHHLGLDPKIIEVDVYAGAGQRPEYLAINPAGTVPTLVDGDLTLVESNAILVYIAEAHGGHACWSKDPRVRAGILRWLVWEAAHWQPTLTAVLREHAGHIMVPQWVGPPSEPEPRWSDEGLVKLLGLLERTLAAHDHGYLAGDEPTLADFAVAGMTIFFRRLGFPFDRYPSLASWYRRVHELPGWQATHAEPWIP